MTNFVLEKKQFKKTEVNNLILLSLEFINKTYFLYNIFNTL